MQFMTTVEPVHFYSGARGLKYILQGGCNRDTIIHLCERMGDHEIHNVKFIYKQQKMDRNCEKSTELPLKWKINVTYSVE